MSTSFWSYSQWSRFIHQLRSVQGKLNLSPFFDGFIPAALNCLFAHLWYLSEEMPFLAFLLKQLTVNEKHQCSKEMLRYKPKSGLALQKLVKVVSPELKKCTKTKNLFGPSWFLIPAKMETAPTFLEVQALQWENNFRYNFLKKTLSKMQVVNASAERAILLAKTYHNKLTTTSNQRSHLYQWYPCCEEKF